MTGPAFEPANLRERRGAAKLLRTHTGDRLWDRYRPRCRGLYLLRVAIEERDIQPWEAEVYLEEFPNQNPRARPVLDWLRERKPATERGRKLGMRVVEGGGAHNNLFSTRAKDVKQVVKRDAKIPSLAGRAVARVSERLGVEMGLWVGRLEEADQLRLLEVVRQAGFRPAPAVISLASSLKELSIDSTKPINKP